MIQLILINTYIYLSSMKLTELFKQENINFLDYFIKKYNDDDDPRDAGANPAS